MVTSNDIVPDMDNQVEIPDFSRVSPAQCIEHRMNNIHQEVLSVYNQFSKHDIANSTQEPRLTDLL
jgi:hypothetical protein